MKPFYLLPILLLIFYLSVQIIVFLIYSKSFFLVKEELKIQSPIKNPFINLTKHNQQ